MQRSRRGRKVYIVGTDSFARFAKILCALCGKKYPFLHPRRTGLSAIKLQNNLHWYFLQ
jgi:hypothetical protein